MLDLALAFVLLLIAAAIVAYVLVLLLRSAGSPLSALAERRRIARSLAHARRADHYIAANDLDAAVRAIRQAFYLRPVSSAATASTIANHHTGLLSRLLTLTDEERHGSLRLLAMAKVDRLLHERAKLQRRMASGLPTAERRAILTELRRSRRELEKALDQLSSEVLATHRSERLH